MKTPSILVIAALKEELAAFISGVDPCESAGSAGPYLRNYWVPDRYGHNVGFLCCGVGGKNARKTMRNALPVLQPKEILIQGYSGALHPDRHPGDLLIVDVVTLWNGSPDHRLPFDSGLRHRFEQCLDGTSTQWYQGSAVCVDRMIDSKNDKDMLRDTHAADCVDMESYHLLDAALKAAIPAVMIRVISDYADESMGLDFKKIPGNAWARRMHFMAHPQQRRAFQRLLANARTARKHMDTAVAAYLDHRVQAM